MQRSIVSRGTQRRSMGWPGVLSLILAIIPVVMIVVIIVFLAQGSMMAIEEIGLVKLFSTEQFTGFYTTGLTQMYGFMPAIWGTLLTVGIAIAIALPVSIAMALVASEYSFPFLSRGIRTALTIFSGIPPIIYAFTGVAIIGMVFMTPKFLGVGLEELPFRALPYAGKSTLLCGLLLAMLVIPFISPMIDDSIRNVPRDLKEASLALGVNRTETMFRITIPYALPAITSAAALGALKAAGDVMIAVFAIGSQLGLPSPLWDVFEKTAPLSSTGVQLAGGFEPKASCTGIPCSTASLTGVLLLVFAFIFLGLVAFLRKRFRQRFSA